MNNIGLNESEFVKDKRKNHCEDCMNANGFCGAQDVLMCWLRKTYLPDDEWYKAMISDIETKQINEITKEINQKILEKINIVNRKNFKKAN